MGQRQGLDPVWLWVWCRPGATALIQPLAWEPTSICWGCGPKKTKKKKKKSKEIGSALIDSIQLTFPISPLCALHCSKHDESCKDEVPSGPERSPMQEVPMNTTRNKPDLMPIRVLFSTPAPSTSLVIYSVTLLSSNLKWQQLES